MVVRLASATTVRRFDTPSYLTILGCIGRFESAFAFNGRQGMMVVRVPEVGSAERQ